MGCTKMEDWYTTTIGDLEKAFGKSCTWAIHKYGSLPNMFTTCLIHNIYDGVSITSC